MLDYTFLLIATLYSIFIPGYVMVELLVGKLKFYVKIPLYFIISVVFSTYTSYVTSLLMGFSRMSVFVDIALYTIPFVYLLRHKYKELTMAVKKERKLLIMSAVVFMLFFIPLSKGYFSKIDNDIYVMANPNWQDGAMHLSIIESISQGNFPPKAPYFSGQKLNYYYFSDLHASLLNVMYGKFLPESVVFLNSFFAMCTFMLSYAFLFSLIRNRAFSLLAGLMSVFFGNTGFVYLLYEVIFKNAGYFETLSNYAYHLNDKYLLLVPPMSDYFLQNRPMAAALGIFMSISVLMISYIKKSNIKYLFLASILNALIIKFQFFGFVAGTLLITIFTLSRFLTKRINMKQLVVAILVIVLPTTVVVLSNFWLDRVGSRSIYNVFLDSLSLSGLLSNGLSWNILFFIKNFNLTALVALVTPFFVVKKHYRIFIPLYIFLITIVSIPFLVTFTIYEYDMFKFFFFAFPLIGVSAFYFFNLVNKKRRMVFYLALFILFFCSFTSINLLIHAYLNKSGAYSTSDYEAGLWIRENTPKGSIFMTNPSIHNSASDIAGRLRVMAFINWPYSHGYNTGVDNVFTRLEDINNYFNNPDRLDLLSKYKVNYIFYGYEERSNFKEAENRLESVWFLEKVYDEKDVKIFKRK